MRRFHLDEGFRAFRFAFSAHMRALIRSGYLDALEHFVRSNVYFSRACVHISARGIGRLSRMEYHGHEETFANSRWRLDNRAKIHHAVPSSLIFGVPPLKLDLRKDRAFPR